MRFGCLRDGFFGKKTKYCEDCRSRINYEQCVQYRIKNKATKFSYNEFY